jgi:hypothetical protein
VVFKGLKCTERHCLVSHLVFAEDCLILMLADMTNAIAL